uniref:HECT-type E3 ubiquitin transferase n=1 Tax=Lactuca sativa TaxID=4236 RepID=A0A9R1VY06_LACSA|nr:hypothetical protein LSAT_V11C400195180 [Lactuca sativa]
MSIFGGSHYSSDDALVNYRVKKLAYACIQATHHNRFASCVISRLLQGGTSTRSQSLICAKDVNALLMLNTQNSPRRHQLKDQLLSTYLDSNTPKSILLKAAALLIDPKLPWSCKIASYLLQQNIYKIFREIVITGRESLNSESRIGSVSLMERVLALVVTHTGQGHCVCPDIDLQWSFASQILTIPFLWQIFPHLKEVIQL